MPAAFRWAPSTATVKGPGSDHTRGEDGQMLLTFDEPQRAIAPGQAVVIYRGDIVLGGGTVTGALK